MKLKRFVGWMDLHYGYEWVIHNGERRKQPVHDEKAVKTALEFLKDFRPDVFILGGDNLNMGFISRHSRGKPRMTDGFRGVKDYEEFKSRILGPIEATLAPGAEKVWLHGNHEDWIEQFLDQNPELTGLVEPEKYLKLKDRGWKVLSSGEVYRLGKLRFIHGDVILRSSFGTPGAMPARKAVEAYGHSIRLGHTHTYQVFTKKVMADKGFHTGVCVPGMCTRSPEYIKNAPNNAVQGFIFGYVNPQDGSFNDFIAVIYRGKFYWNGKVYGGKR